MANGTYGTKRPAFITNNDIDIYYHYRPNRNTDSEDFKSFKKLDELDGDILSQVKDESGNIIPGIYNIKLPLDKFGKRGIYTIYIKPKEIDATILAVSTLAAYPNVRGIVISSKSVTTQGTDSTIFNNGGLVGYRVEYLNDSGERQQEYRMITSSNQCMPVTQNMNSSYQNDVRYRFCDSSDLVFCTVTPSLSMDFNSGSNPFIGTTNQRIKLINTKFNPMMMEVEMVEHDEETISTMLEGDQVRNLDNGIITTFNEDGEIYHQSMYGHTVNKRTGLNTDWKMNTGGDIYEEEKKKLDELKANI